MQTGMMQTGLRFVAHDDGGIIEVSATASNGAFSGVTRFYEGRAELTSAVATLRGFPGDPRDQRAVTFGDFGPDAVAGGVRLRFYCLGGAAHSFVEVTLTSDRRRAGFFDTVTLVISVEAAAVDAFVEGLHALAASSEGTVILAQAI